MKKHKELTEAREILGLPEKSTRKSIKSAYRSMLAKWHPDKFRDNSEYGFETIFYLCLIY